MDPQNRQATDSPESRPASKSMHDAVPVWCDCCSCEAEPYWLEAFACPEDEGWMPRPAAD